MAEIGAKKAPVAEKVTKETSKRSKVSITVDTSPEDVIDLDSKGFQLAFPAEGLVKLDEEQTRSLSYDNRVAYGVALALSKEAERKKDLPKPMLEDVKPPMAASAGRRLEVIGIPDGWHYCWKRTDELHESSLLGYTMAGDEVQSFATRVGSTHRVSALGVDELVLMRIPKKMFDKGEREVGEQSRRLIDSQANSAKEAIAKAGGIPFEPSEKDGRSWQEANREEIKGA